MAGESRLLSALAACRARLSAFIRGRTAVRDDADDILQEVTLQLMKVEQPVENVAAWLFRAARNEMTDRSRKKRELPLTFDTDEDGDGGGAQMLVGEHEERSCRRCSVKPSRKPSCRAIATGSWRQRAALASRRGCRVNTKRCCFFAAVCERSTMNLPHLNSCPAADSAGLYFICISITLSPATRRRRAPCAKHDDGDK